MKLYQPLTISALVHLCLYLMALISPRFELPRRTQDVEIVYQNEKKSQQDFVTDPTPKDLEEAVKKLEDKAKHLSRIQRRVEKELIARNSGRTQNSRSQLQERARQELAPTADKNGDWESPPPIDRSMQNQVGREARLGDSSISEYIPEVQVGGFTALNTDQFVHYTFYARTNEQIRNRWVENIRQFLNQTLQTEVNRLAQKAQISQLEVILTSDGHFVKAIVHQSAENPALNESAISAFRQAAPFNNPPSEMVERDGYIHLHYGFHVHFRPRYMASGSR